MLAVAPNPASDQGNPGLLRHQFPWVILASFAVYGCLAMLAGYWLRQTIDTSAAYKAYHRARREFALGRVSVEEVGAASRRTCKAQCSVPRLSKSAPLLAHLARIDALQPAVFAASQIKDESAGSQMVEVWQVLHDEAVTWIELGKPR